MAVILFKRWCTNETNKKILIENVIHYISWLFPYGNFTHIQSTKETFIPREIQRSKWSFRLSTKANGGLNLPLAISDASARARTVAVGKKLSQVSCICSFRVEIAEEPATSRGRGKSESDRHVFHKYTKQKTLRKVGERLPPDVSMGYCARNKMPCTHAAMALMVNRSPGRNIMSHRYTGCTVTETFGECETLLDFYWNEQVVIVLPRMIYFID